MLSLLPHFHSVQDPAHGLVLFTFRVGGSPLKHSGNTVTDMPRDMFLNPTKPAVKINYHTLFPLKLESGT